jgi:hypothetical protein
MRILDTIQGQPIIETDDRDRVLFIANADVDCDGSGGNPDHDPDFQPDTSLHFEGRALNPYKERYIVVPPAVVLKTRGTILGCFAQVTNLRTGVVVTAVVGDLGPTRKIGEVSVACAKALGLNPSPIDGGTDAMIIGYEIFPSESANIDGISYDLQPYRGGDA